MDRRVKAAMRLVEAAGLVVIDCDVPRSGHIKAHVRRDDGSTALFIFAGSPSDVRASQNNLSRLRRFARGDFNPVQERP